MYPSQTLLSESLSQFQAKGLGRVRHRLDSPCGRLVEVNGHALLNFASNDYLGLARHPKIIEAMVKGAQNWGAGSGASHLVSGHLAPHDELEKKLAQFLGFERCLTFSTGYLANLAVTPTLASRGAAVFSDKLNHASLIDAMQLSKANGASVHRYAHNDGVALENLLAACTSNTKIIVTDAVFSMDGDLAPLKTLLDLANRFDAWLVIDDAHGFGVLGDRGQGTLQYLNLPASPRILLMGTLGKAAGVSGAFVAGSALAIEYLLQKGRSYIFTTAAPPAVSCALLASLELIRDGHSLRQQLQNNVSQLRSQLGKLPYTLLPSETAIQPLIIGNNLAATRISKMLWAQGFWVPAIRPPTVPEGTARLRISVSAAHTSADISALIDALAQLG